MADATVFNTYNNIVGKIGGIARHASGYITKAASLFDSGDGWSSSSIRDAYLGGFLGDTAKFTPNVFSRLFDEPTYLTFRVVFDFDPNPYIEDMYSDYTTQFDYLPEPLLVLPHSNETVECLKIKKYSTWKYLARSLGDYYRKDIFWLFANGLKDLSENYSYYFQSIDGLGDLMKVAPGNGIRIKDDEGIIKIKCYEGLDMKVTQLMQLYRKAAWDDVYQRWILPDMMRFFSMKIYISEIRLFHSMSSQRKSRQSIMYNLPEHMNTTMYDNASVNDILRNIDRIIETASAVSAKTLGTNSTVSQILNSANATMDAVEGILTLPGEFTRLCNNAFNDVMPTICLECHQCEFVLDDTLEHINTLSSSNSKEQTEPTITIKVGRLIDKQIYPLNVDLETADKYYNINIEKPYMRGAYTNDEILAKNYDYDNDPDKTYDKQSFTNTSARISSGRFRMRSLDPAKSANQNFDTKTNDGMSYQLFNSPKDNTALSMTYSVLNQFTPQEALSAATSIREIKYALDHGEYADMIKSVATDEETQNRIKFNVFSNVLDNLSKSTATDTSLSKLSRDLLYYMQEQASEYRSKATEAQTDIEI